MILWRKNKKRDQARLKKAAEAQEALDKALVGTTQAADAIANVLRSNRLSVATGEAVLVCNTDGRIRQCNGGAMAFFRHDVANCYIDDILRHDFMTFPCLVDAVCGNAPQLVPMVTTQGNIPVEVMVMKLTDEAAQRIVLAVRERPRFRVVSG
jgi:hypothetical protein